MALAKRLVQPFEKCIHKIQKNRYRRYYVGQAKRNFKDLPEKKYLTREQKREIRAFYKKLTGERVPLIWHQYFYSRTGVYSKEYLPTSLYRMQLMDKANMDPYRDAYVDKNMIDTYLPHVRHPKAYLKRINGYFYIDDEPVSGDEAVRQLSDLDGAIIKPTLASHGIGVRKLSIKDGITNIDNMSVSQLFDEYGKNFIIQEFVHQHERLAALNPSSVNTIRILTYRSDMEVIPLYAVIRIGREGKEIDNESSGGISTRINPDGTLGKYAFSDAKDGRFEKTDSGIVLDGYEIPYFKEAVETVKRCHYRLPFFDLIGWDVSISPEGEPIIIEWNIHTELSQSAYGPAFGKYTERIVGELWGRENTHDRYW